MEQKDAKFESWAVVEVMGHKRFAGFVTEQAFGSQSMLRIDVPEIDETPAFTKLIGIGSIYAITPCTEAAAREMQRHARPRAFSEFDLPRPSRPALAYDDDDEPDDERY